MTFLTFYAFLFVYDAEDKDLSELASFFTDEFLLTFVRGRKCKADNVLATVSP
jgi:hypothetical protein